jgi:hypothetical protein
VNGEGCCVVGLPAAAQTTEKNECWIDDRRAEGSLRPTYKSSSSSFWNVVEVVAKCTVAIGLTLFELSEEVEFRYMNGKDVRVVDIPQQDKRRRRWALPENVWRYKRDVPTGRLRASRGHLDRFRLRSASMCLVLRLLASR